MMSARLLIAACAVLFLSAPASIAQDGGRETQTSPINMFDNFFTSMVAARQCDVTTPPMLESFLENALVVQTAALAALQQANPNLAEGDLRDMLNARARSLGTVTVDLVTRLGCDDEKVQTLIQLFRMHASMDFDRGEGAGG